MNIEEARRVLALGLHGLVTWQGLGDDVPKVDPAVATEEAMKLADAYALQAHVAACEHPPIRPTCGQEGAYCDVARKIKEAR